MLHARLTGDCRADQVIANDEIGGGAEISDHRHAREAEGEGDHPGAQRQMPDLVAARQNQNVLLGAFAKDLVSGTLRHVLLLKDESIPMLVRFDYTSLRLTNAYLGERPLPRGVPRPRNIITFGVIIT